MAETGTAVGLVVSALLHAGLLCLPLDLSPASPPEEPPLFVLEEGRLDRQPPDAPRPARPRPPIPPPSLLREALPALTASPILPEPPPPASPPPPPPAAEALAAPSPFLPVQSATMLQDSRHAPAVLAPSRGAETRSHGGSAPQFPPSAQEGSGRVGPPPAPAPPPAGTTADVGPDTGLAPRFVHREIPRYPPLARRLGEEGRVLLRLTIDEQGHLGQVEVLEPADHGFTEAALEAVKRSTYAPAVREGKPVPSRALLPVRFTLRSPE